jgi:saccharopine dehydrogenase (NADP+, L-glutamate forming)
MSQPRHPSVHWVGTGLSTGSGLAWLARRPAHVVVWGRTAEKAAACAARVGLAAGTDTRSLSDQDLAAAVAPGDVVVSMLPPAEHARLLQLSIDAGAHFACSSFTSEPIAELTGQAAEKGLVVLTESGIDPGVDHLFAKLLIDAARKEVGDGPARVTFRSYCGGLPAEPDEFCYRFSWAPRGVLMALLSSAQYLEDGQVTKVEQVWEAVEPYRVGDEDFEAYPNRDSVSLIDQYRLPAGWTVHTFVRGTLRTSGWKAAWADIFAALATDGAGCVDELAADLSRRYPISDADRDRLVLAVDLEVAADGQGPWSGRYVMDLTGTAEESAMAKCVSTPLAIGIGRILDGALPPGLNRSAESADEARKWVEQLQEAGMTYTYSNT